MSPSRFQSGAENAEKQASKGGGRFTRTEYLRLATDEQKVVRFLTDMQVSAQFPWVGEWLTVDQHLVVPTKPKPAEYKGDKWPQAMGAVCRYTVMGNGERMAEDCYICDEVRDPRNGNKPWKRSARTWAIACLREPVTAENGQRGYRDALREIDEVVNGEATGRKLQERELVVVNMAWSNFFSPLQTMGSYHGDTVMGRDYVVKRTGEGLQTQYNFINLDGEASVYDAREPWVFGRYCNVPVEKLREWKADPSSFNADTDGALLTLPIDLDEEILKMASDDWYARWFDPTKTVTWGNGKSESDEEDTGVTGQPTDDGGDSKAKFDRIRERVLATTGSTPVSNDDLEN